MPDKINESEEVVQVVYAQSGPGPQVLKAWAANRPTTSRKCILLGAALQKLSPSAVRSYAIAKLRLSEAIYGNGSEVLLLEVQQSLWDGVNNFKCQHCFLLLLRLCWFLPFSRADFLPRIKDCLEDDFPWSDPLEGNISFPDADKTFGDLIPGESFEERVCQGRVQIEETACRMLLIVQMRAFPLDNVPLEGQRGLQYLHAALREDEQLWPGGSHHLRQTDAECHGVCCQGKQICEEEKKLMESVKKLYLAKFIPMSAEGRLAGLQQMLEPKLGTLESSLEESQKEHSKEMKALVDKITGGEPCSAESLESEISRLSTSLMEQHSALHDGLVARDSCNSEGNILEKEMASCLDIPAVATCFPDAHIGQKEWVYAILSCRPGAFKDDTEQIHSSLEETASRSNGGEEPFTLDACRPSELFDLLVGTVLCDNALKDSEEVVLGHGKQDAQRHDQQQHLLRGEIVLFETMLLDLFFDPSTTDHAREKLAEKLDSLQYDALGLQAQMQMDSVDVAPSRHDWDPPEFSTARQNGTAQRHFEKYGKTSAWLKWTELDKAVKGINGNKTEAKRMSTAEKEETIKQFLQYLRILLENFAITKVEVSALQELIQMLLLQLAVEHDVPQTLLGRMADALPGHQWEFLGFLSHQMLQSLTSFAGIMLGRKHNLLYKLNTRLNAVKVWTKRGTQRPFLHANFDGCLAFLAQSSLLQEHLAQSKEGKQFFELPNADQENQLSEAINNLLAFVIHQSPYDTSELYEESADEAREHVYAMQSWVEVCNTLHHFQECHQEAIDSYALLSGSQDEAQAQRMLLEALPKLLKALSEMKSSLELVVDKVHPTMSCGRTGRVRASAIEAKDELICLSTLLEALERLNTEFRLRSLTLSQIPPTVFLNELRQKSVIDHFQQISELDVSSLVRYSQLKGSAMLVQKHLAIASLVENVNAHKSWQAIAVALKKDWQAMVDHEAEEHRRALEQEVLADEVVARHNSRKGGAPKPKKKSRKTKQSQRQAGGGSQSVRGEDIPNESTETVPEKGERQSDSGQSGSPLEPRSSSVDALHDETKGLENDHNAPIATLREDVEEKPQLIPESRLELEHPLLSEEIPELSEEVPELRIPLADALPAQENLNTQGENVKTLPASQPEKIVQKKGHGTAMPMKVQSHPEGHREVAISMKDGKPSHIQENRSPSKAKFGAATDQADAANVHGPRDPLRYQAAPSHQPWHRKPIDCWLCHGDHKFDNCDKLPNGTTYHERRAIWKALQFEGGKDVDFMIGQILDRLEASSGPRGSQTRPPQSGWVQEGPQATSTSYSGVTKGSQEDRPANFKSSPAKIKPAGQTAPIATGQSSARISAEADPRADGPDVAAQHHSRVPNESEYSNLASMNSSNPDTRLFESDASKTNMSKHAALPTRLPPQVLCAIEHRANQLGISSQEYSKSEHDAQGAPAAANLELQMSPPDSGERTSHREDGTAISENLPHVSQVAGAGATNKGEEMNDLMSLLGVSTSHLPKQKQGPAATPRQTGPPESQNGSWQETVNQNKRAAKTALAAPGLQNDTGEYNCFLNCILQCLWSLKDFRDLIGGWMPEADNMQENAVVSSLVQILSGFAVQEVDTEQKRVISPILLRKALHTTYGQRFAIGEMSDAAEVLSAIYDELGKAQFGAERISRMFEWHVHQFVYCPACNLFSHETLYSQWFYYASATALRQEAAKQAPNAELGSLLSGIDMQLEKTCDTDLGGCSQMRSIESSLKSGSRPARVFTIQLAWETNSEDPRSIRETVGAVSEVIDVARIFSGGGKAFLYKLQSVICYYGQHYHAFVRDKKTSSWCMYDDITALEIGSWSAVQQKCQSGRLQPSVLFYEATWGKRYKS